MVEIQRSETISGVVIVEPQIFQDPRGFFAETWRQEWLPESRPMIQSNRADRSKGTLVGLHYHLNQADYWYVSHGVAQVVLHDLRQGSPTQGSTLSFNLGSLDQSEQKGVYIPPGVAHGFAAITDITITYLVDSYYDPQDELGVAWNDPEIGAVWEVDEPVLSVRDQSNPLVENMENHLKPNYQEDQ